MTAWLYCSKEDVAEYASISQDILRDEWSLEVQAMIDRHLGRSFYSSSDLPVTAAVDIDGDGSDIFVLPHRPGLSVTALSISDVDVGSSSYELYSDAGYIRLVSSGRQASFPVGVQNVHVEYTHGESVPSHVRACATVMIATISLVRERGGNDGSISLGMSQGGVGGPDIRNRSRDISGKLQSIMDKYLGRRWRVA